jgi:hypothetical protein
MDDYARLVPRMVARTRDDYLMSIAVGSLVTIFIFYYAVTKQNHWLVYTVGGVGALIVLSSLDRYYNLRPSSPRVQMLTAPTTFRVVSAWPVTKKPSDKVPTHLQITGEFHVVLKIGAAEMPKFVTAIRIAAPQVELRVPNVELPELDRG